MKCILNCKRSEGVMAMIKWIRRCFCKHEFELVQRVTYADCVCASYMCKHCGWIRKIIT